MSVNSKMTAIADEIRTLSGTSGIMGLDAMASTLHTENASFTSNLTTQNDLITQIQTALEGKAAGGSSESSSLRYFYYLDGARLIGSFRIYFEDGMTWAEFVNSDYNISLSEYGTIDFIRFSSDENGVYDNCYGATLINDGCVVSQTDLIIHNSIYET